MGYLIALFFASVILLLLFSYLRLEFFSESEGEKISVALRLLFIKVELFSKKEEKKKANGPVNTPAEKEKKESEPKEKKKTDVRLILNALRDSLGSIGKFLRGLKIRKLAIDISVGSPDAAKTAIDYGSYNACVGAALSTAESIADIKYKRINVFSNFLSEKTDYRISFEIKGRIWNILKLGINLVKNLYINMQETKGEEK